MSQVCVGLTRLNYNTMKATLHWEPLAWRPFSCLLRLLWATRIPLLLVPPPPSKPPLNSSRWPCLCSCKNSMIILGPPHTYFRTTFSFQDSCLTSAKPLLPLTINQQSQVSGASCSAHYREWSHKYEFSFVCVELVTMVQPEMMVNESRVWGFAGSRSLEGTCLDTVDSRMIDSI